MTRFRLHTVIGISLAALSWMFAPAAHAAAPPHEHAQGHAQGHAHGHGAAGEAHGGITFDLRNVRNGNWSNPKIWEPQRVPRAGDRVLISRGSKVTYDVASPAVLRLVQVVGVLEFSRDRDTEMNVAILKVQNSDTCSESGFACDFAGVNEQGEPGDLFPIERPQLLIGTLEQPIPAEHTAKIRLHYLEGLDKNDAPALVCCGARMEIHGAPLSRTWVKLGADAQPGEQTVELAEEVSGWRVGDEVLVTGSLHKGSGGSFRQGEYARHAPQTEERTITRIEGRKLHLNAPLKNEHFGSGEFRSEVANLSRNVVVESADPKGVRGHTLYHRHSRGGVSYARFAHLGKEGVLGRYALHFHLLGETMRGSQVLGAAIVDSHNRWITVHGTQYLVIRDCVGYRSVGHGFFLEDGTEVYNLLDRNLGVQAFQGGRLPGQVLPFDPNDGAAYWWANARNSLVRNVSCENDQYGFRYDSQSSRSFDPTLPVLQPDGTKAPVDIRTIGTYRFEENEAHTEGLYGVVFAGNNQAGGPISRAEGLDRIDRTGPDRRHPHTLRKLKIWQVHYALRPQIPQMQMEEITIDHAVYGIYRPMFENHEYRQLTIAHTNGEPFNRGMDDASTQFGSITVDGLTFEGFYHGGGIPLIQIADNDPSGAGESHFRNVQWRDGRGGGHRAIFDLGGGARTPPVTKTGVAYYLHDHFGTGVHAKIVSRKAANHLNDGREYRAEPPLTGRDVVLAEARDIEFPRLLDPVDDLPPATVITAIRGVGDRLEVRGISHDNGEIVRVLVNGREAEITAHEAGVADWLVELDSLPEGTITAHAVDAAGNVETHAHRRKLD